jgi:Ca2+-binding EF-hand superfamily protein|eukprot:COSAG01_NODE_5870_length_3980_cov_35.431847_6_plen_54_part_00
MDEDASGYLDQEEVNIVMKMMGRKLSKKELRAAFEAMDPNDDKQIDYDEFAAW